MQEDWMTYLLSLLLWNFLMSSRFNKRAKRLCWRKVRRHYFLLPNWWPDSSSTTKILMNDRKEWISVNVRSQNVNNTSGERMGSVCCVVCLSLPDWTLDPAESENLILKSLSATASPWKRYQQQAKEEGEKRKWMFWEKHTLLTHTGSRQTYIH